MNQRAEQSTELGDSAGGGGGGNGASLSDHVFSKPEDFLKTIRDNYDEFSHSHENITLADLKIEETGGSTAEIRQAARIATDHFDELNKIADQQPSMDARDEGVLSKDDLDFDLNMTEGKTFGTTLYGLGTDLGRLASGAMFGAFGAGLAYSELVGPTFLGGGAASAVFGATGVGFLAAGVGVAGYSMYRGVKDFSEYSQDSRQDIKTINSWL